MAMNDKERDHICVSKYHDFNRILVNCIQGLMCGYDECCIKFCLLRRHGEPIPPNPYLDDGVVMCHCCAANVEATKQGVISRRWLASPFPKSIKDDWPEYWPKELKAQAERLAAEIYAELQE